MSALWYFIHIFGYTIWIGGALAAMVVSIAARKEPPGAQGTAIRLLTRIYPALVGPGTILTVLSGFILTLRMYNRVTAVGINHWMMAMQGLGLVAGILIILVVLPTAAKLSRVDPISDPAAFEGLRRRLAIWGMGANSLAFITLVTGALYRFG